MCTQGVLTYVFERTSLEIARFHLTMFLASFSAESINSRDGWSGLRQSKFKFAKSSHTTLKTGRVVNNVQRLGVWGFFLFVLEEILEIFAAGREGGVRRGGRGPVQTRGLRRRDYRPAPAPANYCRNTSSR